MSVSLPAQDLQGTIVKRRDVPGFRLTENLYAEGFRTRQHFHNSGLFGCVIDGSFTNAYHQATHHLPSTSVMFCPPGEMHTTYSRRGARCLNVELEPVWMKRLDAQPSPAMFRETFMTGLAMNLYREFKSIDEASSLAMEGLALEMTAWAIRYRMPPRAQVPRWLESVREILHEKFRDPLTISWMAEEVGVHPVYLGSTFRHYCGCGVGDYIRQLRVSYASRELANSESSLAEIGQASGFADQSHFSRTFKRFTGMTPARYRSLFRRSPVS